MESTNDQATLLYELTNGREMAKRLKNHHSSPEVCEALVESILSTYDKALSMLSWRMAIKEEAAASPDSGSGAFSGSPLSEITSMSLPKDVKCNKDVSKKRKASAKWSHQVRVCSKGQDGNSHDDGHSWRKYGQKDILGAAFPRAYYRCTHRNSRGCLATKQVQRTDADSSVFEITYKGNHSCSSQTATNANSIIALDQAEYQQPQLHMLQNVAQTQTLKVETNDHLRQAVMNTDQEEEIFPSFSFPELEPENQENHVFFTDSPTTSDSYYLSSPGLINSSDLGNILLNSQYGETTPTSVMSSPFCDLDFLLDQEPNFAIDALSYF